MERRSRTDMIAGTRAKLIAAARIAFAEKGYAETSMDDLTAAAGLTRGALYHHFGGKEGLLEAVVRQIDGEMLARYDAVAIQAENTWEELRGCCRLSLRMALEPEVRRIVLRDAPAVLGERLRAIDAGSSLAPMAGSLHRLMAEGVIAQTDPEALARLLNGGLLDTALWIAKADDPDEALEKSLSAFDTLLVGLRRPAGQDQS